MAGLVCPCRRADDGGPDGTRRAGRRSDHGPPRVGADSRRGGGTHGSTLPRRRSTGGWSSDELDGPAFKHFRDADHDTISFYAGLSWGIAGYMGGAGELGPAGFFANSAGRRSIWKCVPRRPRAGPQWGSLLGDRRRAGHSLGTPASGLTAETLRRNLARMEAESAAASGAQTPGVVIEIDADGRRRRVPPRGAAERPSRPTSPPRSRATEQQPYTPMSVSAATQATDEVLNDAAIRLAMSNRMQRRRL